MVYHWMYIHGINVVYRGISMDIPSVLKPDFAAGLPVCCQHRPHRPASRKTVMQSMTRAKI